MEYTCLLDKNGVLKAMIRIMEALYVVATTNM